MEQKETNLEEFIANKQAEWGNKIKELNEKFKTISTLSDLTTEIYTTRQDLQEYHKSMLMKCASLNREYKKKYAELYNSYKTTSQIKYTSDQAINAQIAAQLADFNYTMDLMNHHTNYIDETIKTVDNLIYGIKNRIDIEQLLTTGMLK